jgi:hypothetical protein
MCLTFELRWVEGGHLLLVQFRRFLAPDPRALPLGVLPHPVHQPAHVTVAREWVSGQVPAGQDLAHYPVLEDGAGSINTVIIIKQIQVVHVLVH